ncbi:M20 metallopeptidase family protein [Sporosarcina cascadiensis]|uniref:M20 metallopeptidase family protein n=1 Tax=Sporosarcina cascadiensis TaxID=2660747 RepID=UPI00129BE675|nr:amidohydrolase [Sporosarcina cascadiensis]
MINQPTIESLAEQAIQDRRHLHQYPELSGEEYETCDMIRKRLEGLEIEILDYALPSIVGFVKGTSGGKTIALRADIDALPIQEEGDLPYASTRPGISHMCGHDGHTAVLLAVAEWLAANRDAVQPNVYLLFQSAEEITPSGAQALVAQGVLEDVDAVFGLHLWQGMKKGLFGITHGPMMASIDDFEITITGSGGHGSAPHEAVDPIYISTHVIQAFQNIISQKLNPLDAAIITVGKVEAGSSPNVIPNSAKLTGTIRALTPEAVATIKQQMVRMSEGICQAFGAAAQVEFIVGTPPLVNDEVQARFVEQVLTDTFGKDRVELIEPTMGGEDFAYYLQEKPGAYLFVGMASETSAYPHHHPKFNIDEEMIPDAIRVFIEILQQFKEESL